MAKKVAALDLGTNTFHLVIAEVGSGKINKLVEEQRHAKLGEGGINKGIIADAAYVRGIEALKFFRSVIDAYPVESIKASGTAALRAAANGKAFIEEVYRETGIKIDIIEGEREAELIYKGVNASTDLGDSALIMDIGGGSVEFIFCSNSRIFWKKSYPVGAAKLMAAFHHSDPISAQDIEGVERHLWTELKELQAKAEEFKPSKLVGSAGAFETFALLETETFQLDNDALLSNTYSFYPKNLEEILENLIASTHQKRAGNKLIIPVRTDMIVVASVLTRFILNALKIETVEMTRYSLKEGLLVESSCQE